jgi:hypothetical protein
MPWDSNIYRKFRRVATALLRVGSAFCVIFTTVYFIGLAAWGAAEGILVPATAFFDMLEGAAFMAILVLCCGLAHTRIGAIAGILPFIYWWEFVSRGIVINADIISRGFLGAVIVMGLPWLFLCATALLGLVAFFLDCTEIAETNRSFWLGPWFRGILREGKGGLVEGRGFTGVQKRAIRNTIVASCVAAAFVLSGIASYAGAFTYTVTITPANYNITYNFWATPNINGTYAGDEWGTQYHIGPDYYPNDTLDQFNKYHVNLDLTFNVVDNTTLPMLMQWEHRCPNITYRITMYPIGNNLSNLESQIENATNLLMGWEVAGNISHWVGFAFDIEGAGFTWWSGFSSYSAAAAMWNRIFDFIAQKSAIRGKTIDMECISDLGSAEAAIFPGSSIEQASTGDNNYVPNRFTVYAPMLYRCWYKGTKPFGSSTGSSSWPTSYQIY